MLQEVIRDPSLVFLAIVITAFSGVPGLFLRKPSAQKFATACALLASSLALPTIVALLLTGGRGTYSFSWNLPFGPCELALDPLSLFFLIPIFVVFAAGSLYANGYWPAACHRATFPSLTFFYGLLSASMALVVTSRNGVLLLVSWEVMALSGYFLLVTEHEEAQVRGAGTVYLIASHIGAAALLALFSLLRLDTGSFLLPATGSLRLEASAASVLFLLALVGFGSKAGIMPLHVWLPSAHANAPSHVSALLSGVMLKMGIYGMLRVLSFIPERPIWWGGLLVVAGLLSALVGIALASAQKDIKRLLAYSSIENLGIVTAAIGTALLGESAGESRLAFLGGAAALFHVLNHSLFKPLLFFSAGSVMHATGTRDLDLMGGLGKRMPITALLSLCGAIAICGLPPFNGFVSEFLLYLGFFGEARSRVPSLALGAPALALVGGMAVVSFVKLYGIAFLGSPRSPRAQRGHESSPYMLLPMALLALLCLTGGLFPQLYLALVSPALASFAPHALGFRSLPLSPLWFAAAGGALLLVAGVGACLVRKRAGSVSVQSGPTWGCGYLKPQPRMQYTGSSFSQLFISLFPALVRVKRSLTAISGVAPATGHLQYLPEETILDRCIRPLFEICGIAFSYLRRLQHGEVQIYICYIFATLLLLMLWTP